MEKVLKMIILKVFTFTWTNATLQIIRLDFLCILIDKSVKRC